MARAFVALIVVALSLGSSRAAAQSADALIEQGVALREQGRDEEAADVFARALEREPTPRARAQLGLAEQALGRWVDAERHVADALEERQDRWIASRSAVLEEALAEIRSHVGSLDVHADVAGAELRIGTRLVATLPLARPVHVEAGEVELRVSARGWRSARRRVDVTAGETVRVGIELVRSDADGAPRSDERGGGSTAATVALVGAGVLAAGAIGAGIWWAGRQSEVDVCATSGCLNADELESVRTAAAVTTIVAGALAIATATVGVVLFVSSQRPAEGVTVACSVGAASARCAVRF